ncbi:hypothetical protein CVT25_014704 [Psilocybe cyanescens]|uniref:G domain-containing protein n=1 Tax=Psilocybe cyanescens TaxID=93625 RepID=A0A409WR27_PSICY|nr:hypothetical protein CVT25_014704 [Psilocybe cyanescens]
MHFSCLNLCFRTKGGDKAYVAEDNSQIPEERAESPAIQQVSTSSVAPTSRAKQEPQIPSIPKSLPSQVDDTLGECPRFRIVVVGKSGIGKSSLIANIFNLDKNKIDIAHKKAGEADIEYGYTSLENPRFILHDSKGFEAGSRGNWEKVEKFLETRKASNLLEKVHAIWWSCSLYFSIEGLFLLFQLGSVYKLHGPGLDYCKRVTKTSFI